MSRRTGSLKPLCAGRHGVARSEHPRYLHRRRLWTRRKRHDRRQGVGLAGIHLPVAVHVAHSQHEVVLLAQILKGKGAVVTRLRPVIGRRRQRVGRGRGIGVQRVGIDVDPGLRRPLRRRHDLPLQFAPADARPGRKGQHERFAERHATGVREVRVHREDVRRAVAQRLRQVDGHLAPVPVELQPPLQRRGDRQRLHEARPLHVFRKGQPEGARGGGDVNGVGGGAAGLQRRWGLVARPAAGRHGVGAMGQQNGEESGEPPASERRKRAIQHRHRRE